MPLSLSIFHFQCITLKQFLFYLKNNHFSELSFQINKRVIKLSNFFSSKLIRTGLILDENAVKNKKICFTKNKAIKQVAPWSGGYHYCTTSFN